MSVSVEELQRALDWAKRNNDQDAVDAVTAEIEKMQRGNGALDESNAGTVTPSPATEDVGALGEVQQEEPVGALQDRERSLAASAYEKDQQLASDPANKPTRSEMRDWIRTNTDVQFGTGQYNTLGQQVIRDPETGTLRWTALSPDDMERAEKIGKGSTVEATVGALAYGSTRFGAATVSNIDAEIESRQQFQDFLLNSDQGLPKSEQDRIKSRLAERYGPDHRYAKNPGMAPPNLIKGIMDENPDNDAALQAIIGNEKSAARAEWFKRLGNKASALVPGMPLNVFGADETLGALTGPGQYENIEYEEGEAPAYPGVSAHLKDWRKDALRPPSLYESFVKPLVEGKTGEAPGEILTKGAESLRDRFYSEEQQKEAQMPILNPDVEVNKFSDLFNPDLYTGEDTKLTNPESLWLMLMENAPELGFAFAVTRGAGSLGARSVVGSTTGKSVLTSKGREMALSRLNKARETAAGRSGMLAGGTTEGLLVQGHVEKETREILSEVPMETWQENPLFQKYVEAGMTEEAAKQIMMQDAASKAGVTAGAITIATGAPMNRFMARSAAGRLIQSRPTLRKLTGLTGEPITEGAQEVMEMLQTEAAVRPIDPDNPIFKDPNRYAEAFFGGALISLPFGAMSALEPDTPAGFEKADSAAVKATAKFMQATNERFKYESKIASPEHIAKTTPNNRLVELEKLESLQEKEANALLEAEPAMREHLEKLGTAQAQAELKMLNRLVMRANSVKTDIAVARANRTTASELQEKERKVIKERADLQKRVTEDVLKLEDIERLTQNIEKVQNLEAISNTEAEELIDEGYAKRRESDGQLVILPKGKRATKELNRQARMVQARLDSGYAGSERRQGENAIKRQLIDEMGPVERERALYTDTLTEVQNRRAFNERQERIDSKKEENKGKVDGAAPAVASVDVDSLKWVNDNMAHSAGDRMLMAVADVLNSQEGVEVFRLGGDEFAVTGPSQEALETALQAAATQLSETEITSGEDSVTPTITWGKGETYEQADAQSVDMKRDRVRRGVVADRTGKPAGYKVKSQMGLFHGISVASIDNAIDQLIESDTLSGVPFYARVNDYIPSGDGMSLRVDPDTKTEGPLEIVVDGEKSTPAKMRSAIMQEALEESMKKVGAYLGGKNITPERAEKIRKIARMRIDGKSLKEISKEVGLSVGSVEMYISRANLPNIRKLREKQSTVDVVDLLSQGMITSEISEELGLNPDIVRKKIREAAAQGVEVRETVRRSPTTKKVREEIKRLVAEGKTQREIEKQTGVSRPTITKITRGLFMQDSGDGQSLPRTFQRVKDIVERGDNIEILAPDGAVMGVVTEVTNNRGRGRIRVNIMGREFLFNADSNHLIVDPFTDPADLAWITGDAEYAQPGRDSFPQILRNVQIGHIGKGGTWYADLGADYEPDVTLPWWMDAYPDLDLERTAPVAKLPEVIESDIARAEAVKEQFIDGYGNLPKINIVRSIQQLKREEPQIVDQIIREGGNLNYVKGYMDHINPKNGVYIFVQNIGKGKWFEQSITEVLAHEMIGHWGVRGFYKYEAALRKDMLDLVKAFPRLADHYGSMLGLNKSITEDAQLIGEEMVAYIAGEVESGREILKTQQQKSLWQRILFHIKRMLSKMGLDRWSPVKKIVSIHDSKEIFWNDSRVQQLLNRSKDFLRTGKKFEWYALGGSTIPYMRDGHIFQSGVLQALDAATFKPTNREKNELASRYGGKENVPEEVPLFPDDAKIGAWVQVFNRLVKEKWATERDLELSGLSPSSEYYLFRDATYADLKALHDKANNGQEDVDWHHGILPAYLSKELDDIRDAYNKNTVIGPMPREYYNLNDENQYKERGPRPVINEVSATAMRNRTSDILNQKIDKKKTIIPKEIIRSHLLSDNAFRVTVSQHGKFDRTRASYEQIAQRLFGDLTDEELNNLSEEQHEKIKAERKRVEEFGWDIGYDEEQQRWFDWTNHTTEYSEWSPQGSRINRDFRVALVQTEGRGGEMGYSGHYDANLMHIRTGVAQLLDVDGKPLITTPNPAMENMMLSLIELQSDWLQKRRKGFVSGDEKENARVTVTSIQRTIQSAVQAFGTSIGGDLRTNVKKALTPIANLPDGSGEVVGSGGSLFEELKQQVRRVYDIGNREVQERQWDDLTADEKREQWKSFTVGKLDELYTKITNAYDFIRKYRDELPTVTLLPGSMDARAFEILDNMVVSDWASYLQAALDTLRESIHNTLRYSDNQAALVVSINNLTQTFANDLVSATRYLGDDKSSRMPMLDYKLSELLDQVYEIMDFDRSGIAPAISQLAKRETATMRIAKSVLLDAAAAAMSYLNPAPLVEEMLSPSRVGRHTEIAPGDFSVSVANANEEWLDIELTGTKSSLKELIDAVPKLIETWVTNRAPEKREAAINNASRGSTDNGRPEYPYSEIEEWLSMEEGDVEEGDNLTRDYNVTTYMEFEQRQLENGELESEIIDEAFNNITEAEWNDLDDTYPGVGRAGDEYRSRLEIDEDGDVDNRDAEEYLDEQRDEYRRDVLWDDEDLRMQAHDRIRELWDEEGEEPAIVVGSLPNSWDEDGNPDDHVSIVIIAAEPGSNFSVQIDGEEYDYFFSLDDAKEGLSEQIGEYYNNENINPPPGELFSISPEGWQTTGDNWRWNRRRSIVEKTEEQQFTPNWSMVASNINATLDLVEQSSLNLKEAYETYVTLKKKLRNGVHKDTPLWKDEHWRPLALKYLIADAVRRGFGGVVWNNGLASSTRGGIGINSDITVTPQITWTKEYVTVRGERHPMYVVRSPDLSRPLVVSPNKMIPILGSTVTRLINQQETGKIEVPTLAQPSEETTEGEEQALDVRSNYLVSHTADNLYAVHRREDHRFLGFADNQAEADDIIANDWGQYSEYLEQRRQRRAAYRGQQPNVDLVVEPVDRGGEIISRGLITNQMVGNDIHVITGQTSRSFSHTFQTPLLAGARQSYEDIMYRIWNKELKKYGVQIKETYVKQNDPSKTKQEGGESIVIKTRDQLIEEEHGSLSVQELTGDFHGWVIVSEKKGVLFDEFFDSKRYADDRMDQFISDNYGSDEREGVKVYYFEVNDQMREEFSKPVAPFMMGRRSEPEALKSARGKIGVPKGKRMKDLRDRIKVFRQGFVAEAQQGIFDQFYGLKRALSEAGLSDDAYIDARLTTSLDSMMKGVLYYGHPVWEDGIVQNRGRGLMEILQPVLQNHEDWGMYMAGKRAKDLMMEGYEKLTEEEKQEVNELALPFNGKTNRDRVFNMLAYAARGGDPDMYPLMTGTVGGVDLSELDRALRDIWTDPITSTLRLPEQGKRNAQKFSRSKKIGKRKYNTSPRAPWEIWELMKTMAAKNGVSTGKEWQQQMEAVIDRMINRARMSMEQNERNNNIAFDINQPSSVELIGKIIFGGRESLFDANEIQHMIRLGDSFPHFERVAEEYAEFNKKMLDFAEESGLIDAEARPTWESANYVPFYRVNDDRLIGSSFSPRSGLADQRAPIRRLKGGKQHLGDVVGNIMVNTAKLLDASVKNNAALNAIDALRGTGIVQKKPLQFKPALIEMGQLKKILQDRGVIVPDDEEGLHMSDIDSNALKGFQKMFALNRPEGEGIISVMRDGKREYYYTDDALLFRALSSVNRKQFGEWIRLFTGPKRLLTTLITVDPAFMLANFLRDTGSAFVIGRDHGGNIPFVSALKGFTQALKQDEAIRTMTSAGAAFENGYITGGDPRRTSRLIKQAIKDPGFYETVIDTGAKAGRAWLTLGAAVENSNRVAMYNAAIAAGKSKKRAVFEAKDLMDFSMGGDWWPVRFLIQTVPFLNARNQGLYRLGKSMVENPVAFTLKGMLVGLAGFAVWAAFKDDERYKDLEMWDKHAYFHFWVGDMHFRIPKPFEVGALFNTQVEMWGNYINSKENDAGKYLLRQYGHMVAETFALLPAPQLLAPAFESWINYNFFRQGPVVGFYEAQRLPPDQYRYRTSPTIKELARMLPKNLDTVSGKIRSPLHLQNLYSGYTGTIGKYLLQAADWMVTRSLDYPLPPSPEEPDVPVYGRFVRGEGPPRRTMYEDEVYKQLAKTTEIQGSLNFHSKYGDVDKYLEVLNDPDYQPYIRAAKSLEGVRENIQDVNRAIQAIYMNPEMSREEKTEKINLLEQTRNTLFREGYKLRPGGEYNPIDAPPATDEQALNMIDEWNVDNSAAYMMRLQESAPDTYQLLEMIQNDMASRELNQLAKAGGS